MKRILITGRNGQIGWELQRTLLPLGNIHAFDKSSLDLGEPKQIREVIQQIKPDIIVNAAAYTSVDKAETERESAYAINAIAPAVIAEEAKKIGAILVHYSTDYIFDGTSRSPYKETDSTSPLNFYGKTKLDGELAIHAASDKFLIFRTSWVYGIRGHNFLNTILRLGNEKDSLRIVSDQIGAPTWSHHIARVTADILMRCQDDWGVYNLTSAGQISWFGFAEEIFRLQKGISKTPLLHPITTEEYPLPAKRPKYSVLSNEKLLKSFQLSLPNWKEALQQCMSNRLQASI